jgi:hypothetical protein
MQLHDNPMTAYCIVVHKRHIGYCGSGYNTLLLLGDDDDTFAGLTEIRQN